MNYNKDNFYLKKLLIKKSASMKVDTVSNDLVLNVKINNKIFRSGNFEF